MTEVPANLTAAETQSAEAREQLGATLAELKARLDPRTLAEQAKREATDRTTAVARAGAERARNNPADTGGAVAVVLLFLARHRIARLFHRRKPRRPDPVTNPSPHHPQITRYSR